MCQVNREKSNMTIFILKMKNLCCQVVGQGEIIWASRKNVGLADLVVVKDLKGFGDSRICVFSYLV